MSRVEVEVARDSSCAPFLLISLSYVPTAAFFTDAGWDVMEPVTWAVGFGGLLASAAFLA